MTPDREAHLVRAAATIRSRAELQGFTAQLKAQGEAVTTDLARAIADRERWLK
jgi:hypothetical protein